MNSQNRSLHAAIPQPKLVLASASPRRRDLLTQIGLSPDAVEGAELNEAPLKGELPPATAKRLARLKAEALMSRYPGAAILAADTVVACGRRMLPKAETVDEARLCLTLLSGRRHRVLGGICVVAPDGRIAERLVTTSVMFRRLDIVDIDRYVASGEWEGKAGGYAIQGTAAAFIRAVSGSYSNVVGLDLFTTASLLRGLGFPV
jgi:septum formation protein